MKKPFNTQENEIDWYVNQNPIDKYLETDRVDNQTVRKLVGINSKAHSYRKKTKKDS